MSCGSHCSCKLQVLVMNNQPEPGAHPVFEALQKRVVEGDAADTFIAKAQLYVSFLGNPGTIQDPTPDAPEPDDFNNPDNRPGRFLIPFDNSRARIAIAGFIMLRTGAW